MSKIEKERQKISKRFSKSTFQEIMVNYLNDDEYESHVMKIKGDNAIKVKEYPVKKFRKILYNVLIDFGVDPDDAKAIKKEYKFKNKTIDGMYEFISDFLYFYLNSGKRLNLFDKEDSVASIIFKDVEAEKNKKRKLKGAEIDPVDIEQHRVVKVKSSVPKWKKTVYDKETGKVKSKVNIITENIE